MSFSVVVCTNRSEYLSRALRRSTTPSSAVPSTMRAVALIGAPCSSVRQRPIASKFSSANPIGSITPWHALHVGLERCCSMIARMVLAFSPSLFSWNASTSGGGAAGGVPRMFSRIHAPRITGAVRFAYDVDSSTPPFPSSPQRF